MAKSCPGCGAPMEYDPSFDSLVCTVCGNIVDPQTLSDADDFYHDAEESGPVDIADTLSEMDDLTGEMYDCQVYKCSQCAGEVLVTGTEISTRCVYCGATSVVFSRISKENRPDKIIPFSVSKEEAIDNVKKNLLNGAFVPQKYKEIPPECVRGIYIPYFTFDGTIEDTQTHRLGLTEKTYVFDGSAEFKDLLVECCTSLDDRTTALLEPYNMNGAVDFDTSYLMGFYSNIQDKTPRGAKGTAELKARTIFHSRMRTLSPNHVLKTVSTMPKVDLHRTSYVLLPAWFITINAEGTPYTFLVNGQTGKVAGTAPWNKAKVMASIIGLSAAACALIIFLYSTLGNYILEHIDYKEAETMIYGGSLQLITGAPIVIGIIMLIIAIRNFKRITVKLTRTGSVLTNIFARKRQGGVK
ncbi:MAG: hypothetical protein J5379_03600 [Clostridiales bacterium]|nr:hypothetical protein [Clostridiales bacterium]